MTNGQSLGLIVTAKQKYYPIELSNAELLAHYEMIQEYQQDISANVLEQSMKFKPNPKLIDQQPEMKPEDTREAIVTFLFELSVMTRVTNGIFVQAVRLYDRYCSKRVVLKDQAKLVVATCLWLAAKTWGGCNHIINNVIVPTGGRFYGPNPRARIPRLSELVLYCGGSNNFDESMFLQMERHILDTLNWDVYEPMLNDYVLNADENCLIQYELYERQLEHRRKRQSQASTDSDATVDDIDLDIKGHSIEEDDEDEELKSKIQLINLKRFLMELASFKYEFLSFELFEVAQGIFHIINRFASSDQGPFLATPATNMEKQSKLETLFIDAITETPKSLAEVYKNQPGISAFITSINNYKSILQKKLELAASLDLSRTIPVSCNYESISSSNMPSPVYSAQSHTPMRNVSANSENSIFSVMEQSSPITPQMYSFEHKPGGSVCGSSPSVSSLVNYRTKRGYDQDISDTSMNMENKENIHPNGVASHIAPPRAKFVSTGMYHSPSDTSHNAGANSSRSSLISLPVANVNSIM
ncbi:uncharacterized protein HLK63_I01287 [Nakaseomyces glabratus]|nr:uncharacterized protein GW608_I01287 [Nakaseomyces glabratus]UCS26529.1 uncharacterized protein HLK63_I01287 [Nakaseomyces glabratus]UCS31759.1 uncharacterized protein HLK64_I01287 [Nakaseomyces glabratus]UCS36987.1 uncharacterized protein HLK62_I01287 [Nakaseomyces glabratus]